MGKTSAASRGSVCSQRATFPLTSTISCSKGQRAILNMVASVMNKNNVFGGLWPLTLMRCASVI